MRAHLRKTMVGHPQFSREVILGEGAGGVDGGADDADFVGGGNDFKAAALERAHHNHFVKEAIEACRLQGI